MYGVLIPITISSNNYELFILGILLVIVTPIILWYLLKQLFKTIKNKS